MHAPTLLVPPRRSRPLVVTIHDAVPWTHPQTLTPHGAAWHRTMGAAIAREADAVVVPTRAVAAALAEALPQLAADRVHVIGQGITAALARPDATAAAPVGLPQRYLLSLATLEPRKGLDVLLAALAEPGAPDIPLVVVGQAGWGAVDVQASARALGLAPNRVIELGRVPDAVLAGVLAGAQALVMPSRAEGFGLPVLEAMAAGVPVVTSDDAALVEVGGGAAAVSPREDAAALADVLATVVGDEDLRASMAAAGLVRSRAFDWDDCARRLWALYADLADGRG
ncbi:MAG: glycosyl transferase group 1 [Pseudonocardiales bacterium]|nr:glycosyl transferase group 1 [Jatrophihabitantaceae bacterium]MCW2601905.1 glycosyl transferase group 1 [Pseudonocardiales bacterium]